MLRILLATDSSEDAKGAARFLKALPLPAGTTLQLVTVVGQFGGDVYWGWEVLDLVKRNELRWAESALEETRQLLARDGLEVTTTIREGDPAHHILEAARELRSDLIVVGSEGLTGLDAFVLGSVSRNVAQHARVPVLIARKPSHQVKRVILAVDESEHAAHAAAFLKRLPLPEQAAITLVHVLRPYKPYHGLVPTEPAHLEELVHQAERSRCRTAAEVLDRTWSPEERRGKAISTAIREGDPASEVLALAREQQADLIVAGARGLSPIKHLMVGSVADRLLKQAPCSVLLVRERKGAA